MLEQTNSMIESGKKSLDELLRERSYEEVKSHLSDNGIDISTVKDDDIEALVAAKVEDKINIIKGVGVGVAFSLAFSLLTGI